MSSRRARILKELDLLPVWRRKDAGSVAPASLPALRQDIHDRGYLPHLKAEGGIYFVTFRLADSLPAQVLEQYQALPQQDRSERIEAYLDAGQGECWLKRADVAEMVRGALLRFDGERYKLHAWVIMPNHVHLVIEPLGEHTLSEILHGIKSYSAQQANKMLGRRGASFWQHESYDRLVRGEEEYRRVCEYVVQNPVGAGLAESAQEFAFSSAWVPAETEKRAGKDAGATAGRDPGATSDERRRRILCMDWAELKAAVAGCTDCPLHATRNKTVFGVGDERADWLFVGEGPGADEDAQGEPFVGQAGKLLDNMLAAIGLRRGQDVYIANVVKCRPPGNRNPQPLEAASCEPYLTRQIELIRPRLIVALGRVAAQNLLRTEQTIAALRGKTHDYQGIPLIVTYHPAYLLRSPQDKAKAWEDLCFARATMRRLKEQAATQ